MHCIFAAQLFATMYLLARVKEKIIDKYQIDRNNKGDVSHLVRKLVSRDSDQISHKPGCTETDDG